MLDKKLLQDVQTSHGWSELEKALAEYIENITPKTPFKRETEFDTMWCLAHEEGGEYHLKTFFKWLEDRARE